MRRSRKTRPRVSASRVVSAGPLWAVAMVCDVVMTELILPAVRAVVAPGRSLYSIVNNEGDSRGSVPVTQVPPPPGKLPENTIRLAQLCSTACKRGRLGQSWALNQVAASCPPSAWSAAARCRYVQNIRLRSLFRKRENNADRKVASAAD